MRRPGALTGLTEVRAHGQNISMAHDNDRLASYDQAVKAEFDQIEELLRDLVAIQHQTDFVAQAQHMLQEHLGFSVPESLLSNAWVEGLDVKSLAAFCTFEIYQRFANAAIQSQPLAHPNPEAFQDLLDACGFHWMDITPCSDGRLAHVIRYVLRLPTHLVRRKSYAGAVFDIDDNMNKWVEVELRRLRSSPGQALSDARYLKIVAYHYSSVDHAHEGCAAHGSDDEAAANAARDVLHAFQEAVQNSHCCGASIGLMMIGVDTATDRIKIHLPNADGTLRTDSFVSSGDFFMPHQQVDGPLRQKIMAALEASAPGCSPGMVQLAAHLMTNNLAQLQLVHDHHGGGYEDVGHAERFIGVGVGFEEIQLRNLMYFAYLKTIEEGATDFAVGMKIFKGLNSQRGLPIPVVIRFDYHGHVPGARSRAVARAQRIAGAITQHYPDEIATGRLHYVQLVRDLDAPTPLEVLGGTINADVGGAHP